MRRKGPDVPNHDIAPNPEKTWEIKRWHKILAGAGALALATVGIVAGVEKVSHHNANIRPPQATSAPFETQPATSAPTTASEAPTQANADIPASILEGEPYSHLTPAQQQRIAELDGMSVADFEVAPAPDRMFYAEVFDATYKKATVAALEPYSVGDKRLIPIVDSEGQELANDWSFRLDESYISLEDGGPDTFTNSPTRRNQAVKAAAGIFYSVDPVTFGNPFPPAADAIESATSFEPSAPDLTAPAVVFRESPWFPAGGRGAGGAPYKVVDDTVYPEPGNQFNYIKQKSADGKLDTLLVSSIQIPMNNQFAVIQQPLENSVTNTYDGVTGW